MACPICGKPADQHYKPFCGKRCADVDLARWLNEAYTTPVVEMDDVPPDEEEIKE